MFNLKELEWIQELVEEEVLRRKSSGDYEVYQYDKEIFESILNKIEANK